MNIGKVSGMVFDIKKFAVHHGPGIRTPVFMKRCLLSCSWCQNLDGISAKPQVFHSPVGDRVAGVRYTPEELANLLNMQAAILRANEGSVTFSRGEPLQQAWFMAEVIDLLEVAQSI